jgi:hypothetical protein
MRQIMSSGRCKRLLSRTLVGAAALAGLSASATTVFADPPDRVARISIVNGPVSFRPAATDEWDTATPNYPLTIGDRLWTDRNARTEVDLGDAVVRLGAQTDIGILNLDDRTIQLRMSSGVVNIHLRDGWQDVFELDTPNGAISMTRAGTYRVDVSINGDASTVTVRRGDASVQAGGYTYPVRAQESMELAGFDSPHTQLRDAIPMDAFEDWCATRDRRADTAVAASYVPNDVVGYSDLDDYGSWNSVPEYGPVWTPHVDAGWVPYRDGRWVWIDPWGWTWVDAEPWGFAPFHYGRWVSLRSGWGWVPGHFVERPVYAPALVAFVGGGGWSASLSLGSEPVGWFPLGPREAYVPAYRVSTAYVHRINVPHVNVTNVNAANVTYVNRNVPGAVTAVPRDTFVRSRSVSSVAVAVPRGAAQAGNVVGHAAPVAPQSGGVRDARPRAAAPPAAVLNRPVVVRRQPAAQAQPPALSRPQVQPRGGARPLAQPQTVQPVQPAQPPSPRPARPDARPAPQAQPSSRQAQPAAPQPAAPQSSAPQPQEPPRARPRQPQPEQPQGQERPQRQAQPQRQEQPQRQAQPQRQEQPQRQAEPQRQEQPQRQAEPQHQEQPQRQAQPQRQDRPQRKEQPQPHAQPPQAQPQGQPAPQELREQRAQPKHENQKPERPAGRRAPPQDGK